MTTTRRQDRPARARPRPGPGDRNRVRIIGGQWRSRLLHFPDTPDLRPTPDRVRETLFNWLGQRLDGWTCLDLFAGSGALGFEALSRGASRVVMVEHDRHACAALKANARDLDAEGFELVEGDAMAYLSRGSERFDAVFLDPPFASDLASRVLERLAGRVAPEGRVYVEAGAAFDSGPAWTKLREARAGAVRFALLAPSSPSEEFP